ncbi:hypothetical protein COB57_04405 [Candidatus Peregrinibacteria bacterium]|nr:MAG: hypothetical protein COB57_04405 [Candidatus Peregrinibacteria bacterium]
MKKVLIVEDNLDLSEMYKIALESKGFEVMASENGMNAVALNDTFKPDLVILDLMMPFVSGYDVLKTIRNKGNDVYIVVNSNLSQESDIAKAKELGANEYYKKSEMDPKTFVNKVAAILS